MKWFTGRRIVIRPRGEDGNVLITVVLVSMLIGALSSLVMTTARQADQSSASDKNKEIALAVAESGIHEMVSEISAQTEQGHFPTADEALAMGGPGTTANGPYNVGVSRCVPDPDANPDPCEQMEVTDGYVIESSGSAGIQQFKRERRIRASIEPRELFPGEEGPYSMLSYKSIELKGNDVIGGGDVFANDSITFEQNAKVYGNVTSATSWIQGAKSGVEVFGDVWSGGYHCTPEVPDNPATTGPCVPGDLWGVDLRGNNGDPVRVHGSVRASVSTPCGGPQQSPHYDVKGGRIDRDATANGIVTGAIVTGVTRNNTCTPAAPKKEIDAFEYVPSSYSPAPIEYTSVATFNAARPQQGTFYIADPSPSQTNRVDLSNFNISGDLTIITNTPIYGGNNFTDNAALAAGVQPKLVLVSTYDPPETGLQCLLEGHNADVSECAIHFKNNFQTACNTAVLLHAKYGPVALKNNGEMCGAVMADGVLIKNNLELNYDSRFDRVQGLGQPGYELARWEECPVDGCE